MLEEKVLEKIKEYFLNDKNVAAVYLFGSTVKGRDRTNSDIDLAVLFYPYLDKEERFSAKLGMAVELAEMAGTQGYKIQFDILDLNSANLFFIHQLMKNKQLIIDKDPHYRVEFEVAYRRNFFDLQGFYDLYHKQALKRLKERL
jgi:predicted nucleotidyltransferase